MLVTLSAAALVGVDAKPVSVEVRVGRGIHFTLGGLAGSTVRESHTRIRSAIEVSGYRWPGRGITVNLAPADLPKEGAAYDLPLALGILAASGQLPTESLRGTLFAGELALNGDLRAVRGALAMATSLPEPLHTMMLPEDSAVEAALSGGPNIYGAASLAAVVGHLTGSAPLERTHNPIADETFCDAHSDEEASASLAAVRGQQGALRALEVAAAGGHHLLMIGSPGVGKTLIARGASSLMPPMSPVEMLEVNRIHSVHRQATGELKFGRPFRSLHHSTTLTTLIGGGRDPRPGEVSLAHLGVLFLDELGEWQPHILNALRQPIESGSVNVARSLATVDFPAEFQLIAACNPCPCGYHGHKHHPCDCSLHKISTYRKRFSGPLLDRIDIQVQLQPVPAEAMDPKRGSTPIAERQVRVWAARKIQQRRNPGGRPNGRLKPAELHKYAALSKARRVFLLEAMELYQFSARSHDRVLCVARTIADLAGRLNIVDGDIAEAIQYRRSDHVN